MANTRQKKAMKRVTLTVDPEDHAVIELMAGANDVSVSWLVRLSIREFLERHGRSGVLSLESKGHATQNQS